MPASPVPATPRPRLKLRHLSGLRKTRKTVTEGIGMLRHDGQQPEIAAPKPR